ncbi:MAG: hypothetical protein U1D69_12835 [Polynucleobacter sp.]|uniref:hypothetical protein n=1 Tax=Limnobacter sp. TaxID=2003368 RepID=UPI002736A53B|nr:hypothetical protein [Limnobacter sp.]MDP3273403.1 hypothetical protein [Limnobacter sp.]MDZ4057818.1 hypothetical protein [Polynucleobacter sp.]
MITQERALQMASGRRMFVSMVDHERLTELLNEAYAEALEAAAQICDSETKLHESQLLRESNSIMTSEKFWAAKSTAMTLAQRIRGLKP